MDLRIINVNPDTMKALKMRALEAGKTLRQYVIDLLHHHIRSAK
jgi:hypothetical protein